MAVGYLEDVIDSLFPDSKEKKKLRTVLTKNGASAGFAKEVLVTIGYLRRCGDQYIKRGNFGSEYHLSEYGIVRAGYTIESAVELITKDSEKFCEVVAKTFRDMQPNDAHTPGYIYKALERCGTDFYQ